MILSARMLLLLALSGGIALSVMAMTREGWTPIVLVGVYMTLTVIPLVAFGRGTTARKPEA